MKFSYVTRLRHIAIIVILILIGIGFLRLILVFMDSFNIMVHQRYARMRMLLELELEQEDNPPTIYNGSNGNILPIPSVIVRPEGGIGNQLFQFAAAYSIARRLNTTLFLQGLPLPSSSSSSSSSSSIESDESGQSGRMQQADKREFAPNQRDFALDHFHLSHHHVQYLPDSFIIPTNQQSVYFNELNVLHNELPEDKILVSDDYFESEIFFQPYKSEIMEQFRVKINSSDTQLLDMVQEINSVEESVAVHIRRGDFVQLDRSPKKRSLPISYQLRAMELLQSLLYDKKLTYFIFTDDIAAVKQEFQGLNISDHRYEIVFVSKPGRTSLQEFDLFTHCKHAIISNSTFSWWAAYLLIVQNVKSVRNIVIAPFPKLRQRIHKHLYYWSHVEERAVKDWIAWNHPYPKNWLTLNPYENFQDMI